MVVIQRRKTGIRGFYLTNESSARETGMPHYSSSLRQLSSEKVADTSDYTEGGWAQKSEGKNGVYSNGGPPSAIVLSSPSASSSESANNVHPNVEKEIFL